MTDEIRNGNAAAPVAGANIWHADDGNAEITVQADTAQEAAQEYVDGGNWPKVEETDWIRVWVWREVDGERVDEERITVRLDPKEPECSDDEGHDWHAPHEIVGGIKENPGVWGHGGGVIFHEVCRRCGCGRTTDTWAQDLATGQQGLESVKYEPGKYSAEVERMRVPDGEQNS